MMPDTSQIRADLAVAEERLRVADRYPAYFLVAGWCAICAIAFAIEYEETWAALLGAGFVLSAWKGALERSKCAHLRPEVTRLKAQYQDELRREAGL